MGIQRVSPKPSALVQQCAAGFKFTGVAPSTDTPAFDANGNLVWPEQGADGGGLFEFGQDRPVAVSRFHISVPSADVAGWSLYVTDGTTDVLIENNADTAASYVVAELPIILMRGESLKLVMAGASAGIILAAAVGATIDNMSELPARAGGGGGSASQTLPGMPEQMNFPAAPADTVREARAFLFDDAKVIRILITARGSVATAGTIDVLGGTDGAGPSLLTGGPINLSTISAADVPEALPLTATEADLQGDIGDGFQVVLVNADEPHLVSVLVEQEF